MKRRGICASPLAKPQLNDEMEPAGEEYLRDGSPRVKLDVNDTRQRVTGGTQSDGSEHQTGETPSGVIQAENDERLLGRGEMRREYGEKSSGESQSGDWRRSVERLDVDLRRFPRLLALAPGHSSSQSDANDC